MKPKHFLWTIIILLFLFLGTLTNLITDYWWFSSLNLGILFTLAIKTKILVFVIASSSFFLFGTLNIWIASRFHNKKTNQLSFRWKLIILGIVSAIIGAAYIGDWFTVLQYTYQVPFGLSEPIFGKDISFYIFSLPYFLLIWGFLMTTVIMTLIVVVLDYFHALIIKLFKRPDIRQMPPGQLPPQFPDMKRILKELKKQAMLHMTILGSLVFILLAVKHYLTRYTIMFSEQGIVVGAGYTDVQVYLPIITLLMIIAGIITILFYVWLFFFSKNPKLKKKHIVTTVLAFYIILIFIGPTIIPGIVQSFKVSPNEFNLEKPYIDNNIRYTRAAYGLDNIEEKAFDASGTIKRDSIDNAQKTIDNVRLLDWRPLIQTYKQTQEIRLYYDLGEIDIDRYLIKNKLTQVMLSAREMEQEQITKEAQTWVNKHLVYTHGFGVVISPVNKVTKEGLPAYLVKDIPPKNLAGEKSFDIKQPRIYYGERDDGYVIVNTKTKEFDYPEGNKNQYNRYDGKGGIALDSLIRKTLFALKFKDIKILLTGDITKDSKIQFDRRVQERIKKLTPFLELDSDPYLVINKGRIKWVQDAYTVSDQFPYSQKYGRINYIRNSVKIVVDAYDGTVTYYVSDDKDPIIRTYERIFPGVFKKLSVMDKELRSHLRYPEDLFSIQAAMYSIYHMKDSTVFYNKEDAWQIPYEIYGTGQKIKMEPYYIIMKLPDEQKEEFIIMTPYTPIKKDNMIAWFAARMDGENYGKLIVYKFSKDALVYGPLQIEAKFDQDSEISQQLTLWSQQGSRVTRGNLLVIPIDDSLLYIEPLYLQAEQGQLPQMKRVLVSDGERVVMEKSLGDALDALFGKKKEKTQDEKDNSEEGQQQDNSLLMEANRIYDKILEAMSQQDWTAMGRGFDELGKALKKMG